MSRTRIRSRCNKVVASMKSSQVLNEELILLKMRVEAVEHNQPMVVPIQSLAPDPYMLEAPIQAVVRNDDGEFVASFVEANVGATGETVFEAVDNLKGLILSTYEILREHDGTRLGRSMARQNAVLDSLIRPRD